MLRRLEQLQGGAQFRRVVRLICRHRRDNQRIALKQLANLRRLLRRLDAVDLQPRVYFRHPIDRHDGQPVNLLKLLVDVVGLEERVDTLLPT